MKQLKPNVWAGIGGAGGHTYAAGIKIIAHEGNKKEQEAACTRR